METLHQKTLKERSKHHLNYILFEKTIEKQRAAAERHQISNPEFYYISDFQQSQWSGLKNVVMSTGS